MLENIIVDVIVNDFAFQNSQRNHFLIMNFQVIVYKSESKPNCN
jgi:hypothetical protein